MIPPPKKKKKKSKNKSDHRRFTIIRYLFKLHSFNCHLIYAVFVHPSNHPFKHTYIRTLFHRIVINFPRECILFFSFLYYLIVKQKNSITNHSSALKLLYYTIFSEVFLEFYLKFFSFFWFFFVGFLLDFIIKTKSILKKKKNVKILSGSSLLVLEADLCGPLLSLKWVLLMGFWTISMRYKSVR